MPLFFLPEAESACKSVIGFRHRSDRLLRRLGYNRTACGLTPHLGLIEKVNGPLLGLAIAAGTSAVQA